jgi:type I restriction enzyme S subunit
MNSVNVPKLRFSGFEGEWEFKRLGDLSNLITKGTTPKKFVNNGIRFIKLECFDNDKINANKCLFIDENTHNKELKRSILNEGDILFAIAGATIGKVNIVNREILPANTNQALSIVRLKAKENKEFIYHNLKSDIMRKYILDNISVGAQPNLNLEQMNNFSFFLPTIPEQQKIASFLSSIDEKIQQLSRKKELLEQYKKCVMQQLFSGKLRFKDENGEEYPNWEEKKLGDVAEKRIAKNKDNKINLVFTNSAVQGIVNQRDFFDKDIANQNNLLGYYIVEKNDFVYNPRISSQAPVGPISRNYLDTGIMSPLYSVFRFREGNLDFVECFFNSIVWHKHMKDISNYGARDDRMSFSTGDFYKMPIPFPCIAEQQKIANFLSGIDGKIAQVNVELVKTQEFKKGLLQQMFV